MAAGQNKLERDFKEEGGFATDQKIGANCESGFLSKHSLIYSAPLVSHLRKASVY
jgi:hypothetical protein